MSFYGICNFSCQIQIFPNFLDKYVDLSSGVLVEIIDTQTEKYGIKIPRLSNNTIYTDDFYLCPKDKLIKVSNDLLPFLIPIYDLKHRLEFARRAPQVEFIRSLKVGHVVAVYGTLFNERRYFECRVKYIGTVAELGMGNYIGVEFLHGDEHSQQKIPLALIEKYVRCVGYKGLITTANWLISGQNFRKMNVRKNSCGDPTAKPILSNNDLIMESFMEKFSQFLSSNSETPAMNPYSENLLQKVHQYSNQKSMNQSLSSSQTSLNNWHQDNDSNKNFNNNRNRNRKNSENITCLMDLPIVENPLVENHPQRQIVENPRQRQDGQPRHDDSNKNFNNNRNRNRKNSENITCLMDLPIAENPLVENHPQKHIVENPRQRQDRQPRQRHDPEEEKYNNHWNGRKFIVSNSIYKSRCSFCCNLKEFCAFKKEATGSEIVPFQNKFRCRKCYIMHEPTDMIVIKRCFHVFGKQCLAATVNLSDGGPVLCPAKLKNSPCWTIFSEDDMISFLSKAEQKQYTDKKVLSDFKTEINVDDSENINEMPLIQHISDDEAVTPVTPINTFDETSMNSEISSWETASFDESDQYSLLPNFDEFVCPLCLKVIPERKGVSLQQCFHNFCKECLAVVIKINKQARVQCPFQESTCEEYLLDSEIKILVSREVYDLHLNKSIYQFSIDNGETISFEDYLESLQPVLDLGNENTDAVRPENLESLQPAAGNDLISNENAIENTEIIFLENNWSCPSCLYYNSENELKCKACTFKKPNCQEIQFLETLEPPVLANSNVVANPETILLDKTWDCLLCRQKNNEKEINCKQCTLKNPDCPIKQWMCEICLNETVESKMNCDFCTSERPVPKSEVIEKWICRICGDENKETQKCCRFCLIERPKPVAVVDQPSQYEELLTLEEGDLDLVENLETFECPICIVTYEKGEGVMLRECLHVFCKECLAGTINMSDSPEIKCPYLDNEYTCDCFLQDREIRAAITEEDYQNHLTKSLNLAEKVIKDSYHCLTVDCRGWWVNEHEANIIVCPVCSIENCLNCNVIHTNLTCQQYQDKLFNAPDAQAQRTKEMIELLLRDGSALKCPNCGIIIQRSYGCDWLRCSCMTEICWATKGARWGPRGVGDITGGCRCKVNGVRCTPTCGNCH